MKSLQVQLVAFGMLAANLCVVQAKPAVSQRREVNQLADGSSPESSAESIASLLSRYRREAAAEPSAKRNRKSQKAFEQECLAAHNKWRRLHGAGDLVFDPKITVFAQKRADFIAASDGDEFKHPPDLPFGENLAWHSRETKSCADLVKMWYDEVDLYDFTKAAFSHETGHFTQLVWRSTERVGCARAFSSGPKGGVYLVCNYDPPGNYLGEGAENVLKAARGRPAVAVATTTTLATPTTTNEIFTSTERSVARPPVTSPSTTTSSSSSTTSIATTNASTDTTTKRPESTNTRKKSNKKKNKKKKKKQKKDDDKKKRNKKNKNKNKKKKNKKKPSTTSAPVTTTSLSST